MKNKSKESQKVEAETENKKGKVRKDSDLAKGGKKDKLILVLRNADKLAKANKYKGIERLEGLKSPENAVYRVIKKEGVIAMMNEESDDFNKLYEKAKDSLEDIRSEQYTDNVKDFIDIACSVKSSSKRGVNIDVLKDLQL